MKIQVRVKPNSKKNSVEKVDTGRFSLHVKAPAKEGMANAAIVDLLSNYFDIPKSRITVLRGFKSKNKVIEII